MTDHVDPHEVLRLDAAATPGPWDKIGGVMDDSAESHYCQYVGPPDKYPVLWAYGSNRTANIAFVSCVRTACPALARRVIELEEHKWQSARIIAGFTVQCVDLEEALAECRRLLEEAVDLCGWREHCDGPCPKCKPARDYLARTAVKGGGA